ncbi:hypothetical protein cypCar_00046142 [Cyprinus carpio]|nr:hypothetical protein cypCar_00046142 [Cyprinus carpio]
MSSALRWVLSLCFIITVIITQRGAPFQVELQDELRMLLSLDADDVRPDVSVYSVRVSGEPHTHTLLFTRPADGQTLPHPLQFNASYHGLCYSISLMLGSNSSASRAVRTVPVLTIPNPPLNVSLKIIHLSDRGASGSDLHAADLKASHNASVLRRTRDIPAAEEQEEEVNGEETSVTQMPLNESITVYSSTAEPVPDNSTEPLWVEPTGSSAPTEEEEFVNALVPEYEDSNEPGSAMDMTFEPNVMPTPLPPILLELRWLPPRPPTAYDGFNIYIYHDEKSTKTASTDVK